MFSQKTLKLTSHLCMFRYLLKIVPQHIFPSIAAAEALVKRLEVHVLCLKGAKLRLDCFPLADDDLQKGLDVALHVLHLTTIFTFTLGFLKICQLFH